MRLSALILVAACAAASAAERPLAEVIGDGLKPGATITVPAGTFTTPGITLPAGATLAGAGHGATTIVVTGEIGVTVNAAGCAIRDLAIRGAADADVAIDGAAGAQVSRVRLSGALVGVRARGAAKTRIENAVLVNNRTGAALFTCTDAVVVNCTVADNSADGVFVNGGVGGAVFNTVFSGCPIALVAQGERDLLVDRNAYDGNDFVGKGRDVPMPSVYTWRSYTGYDRHSLMQPIAFTDAAAGDLRPVGALAWARDRTVVDAMGAAKLGAHAAPAADIDGGKWTNGAPAIGAFQPKPITADRPADGEFTVTDGDGDTSVGLYRADGAQIALLVDMVALPKGTYRWWLPSRDWKQEPIAAGSYQLRVAESNLSLRTVATPGNTSPTPGTRDNYANDHTCGVAYDNKDRPVIAHPWSECYQNFRGFAPDLATQRWSVPGCKDYYGMAVGGDDFLYGLNSGDDKHWLLRRIDLESGEVAAITPGEYGTVLPRDRIKAPDGLAELDGTLFLADREQGKVWMSPVGNPEFTAGADVAAPTAPATDRARRLVWVISQRKEVVALAADGAVKHRFTPAFGALAGLAVNKDRMAIASLTEGKIHVFDCTDPAAPKELYVVGTGDGPYGAMKPERFLWKAATDTGARVGLALDAAGRLLVTDRLGAKQFAAGGAFASQQAGIWAQYCETGPQLADGSRLVLEKSYPMVMRLDPAKKTWSFDQWLAKPAVLGRNEVDMIFLRGKELYGFAREGGRLFVIRFDDGVGVITEAYRRVGGGALQRFTGPVERLGDDANWKPIVGKDGKPATCAADFNARLSPTRDGALDFGTVFIPVAVDPDAALAWDWWSQRAVAPRLAPAADGKPGTFASPYDGKTAVNPASLGVMWGDRFSDGSSVLNVQMRTQELIAAKAAPTNGTGFSNHGGSDLIGTDADGAIRWFRPLGDVKDPQGARVVGDLTYVTGVPTQELHIVDRDGMRVGICNVPGDLYWNGMWLDNPWQFNAFADAKGRHHVLYGNFNDCTLWWMEVVGADAIKRSSKPVVIAAAAADALAKLAPPPARPTTSGHRDTRLTIAKLKEPLPIDGSFDAWRAAVPTPQIIATPEAAGSSFKGAKDSSVMMRLAYLGQDLYVQALHFDDVTTTHQLSNSFYLQDCIEMAINSFVEGIKINASRVRDSGDLLVRDGWFIPGFQIDKDKAPRHWRVAAGKDVPDRALMERITGEDLSGCEVQVFTFRVTMDDALFLKREKEKPEAVSGKTMRIGLMVDDNDKHGTDVQRTLSWPATYGTFVSREFSALATFE